jgi:hypothetical protein
LEVWLEAEFLRLCGFEKLEDNGFLFLARHKVDMAVLNTAGAELNITSLSVCRFLFCVGMSWPSFLMLENITEYQSSRDQDDSNHTASAS